MKFESNNKAQKYVQIQKKRFLKVMFWLCVLSIVVFVVSLISGRAGIVDPFEIIGSLINNTDDNTQMLHIWQNIRIPRALASFLIGACLSVAGIVYQTTFNNKLVSPDILGVSAGCCVGAGVAILLGLSTGLIRFLAFIFGFVAVIITIFLPKLFKNRSNITLVLSGIIVGAFMDSVLALIKYIADKNDKLGDIVFWIMGSLVGVQNNEVLNSLLICIIPLIVLFVMGRNINVVSLGIEEAESLGINYKLNRIVIIVCSTLLTANCVSMCGNVGWVGLVIPHIARAFVGDDIRIAMPVSAVCGGVFLMIVDFLSRIISVNEIPLSIITGFAGAIIYTVVLIKRGRYIND